MVGESRVRGVGRGPGPEEATIEVKRETIETRAGAQEMETH